MEVDGVISQPARMAVVIAITGLGAKNSRTFLEQHSRDSIISTVHDGKDLHPAGT